MALNIENANPIKAVFEEVGIVRKGAYRVQAPLSFHGLMHNFSFALTCRSRRLGEVIQSFRTDIKNGHYYLIFARDSEARKKQEAQWLWGLDNFTARYQKQAGVWHIEEIKTGVNDG